MSTPTISKEEALVHIIQDSFLRDSEKKRLLDLFEEQGFEACRAEFSILFEGRFEAWSQEVRQSNAAFEKEVKEARGAYEEEKRLLQEKLKTDLSRFHNTDFDSRDEVFDAYYEELSKIQEKYTNKVNRTVVEYAPREL